MKHSKSVFALQLIDLSGDSGAFPDRRKEAQLSNSSSKKTYLAKDFACLPHEILLDKLSLYGVSSPSSFPFKFICIKKKTTNKSWQHTYSSWAVIQKGVPLGYILEPLLFNDFINVFFKFYLAEHIEY